MKRTMARLAVLTLVMLCPGLLSAQGPQPIDVLQGTALASGLALGIDTSNHVYNWLTPEPPPPPPGDLSMVCPAAQQWCAMFITDGQAISTYPRPGIDVSGYQTLTVEIEGDPGTIIQVGIKDSTQKDDGSETKVTLQVPSTWTTFNIPLSSFTGANLKSIYVLCEFVFPGGSQPQTLKVRTITYSATPPATTMVLPQFVFGGGWYTAVYFTNTTGSPVSFQVNFLSDTGSALDVPSLSGSSVMVNLASRASTVIEAPNIGSLTDGYVSVAIPTGVEGYGVFRSSSAGLPDQEAVVPLTSSSNTTSTLIWDDTNFVTGVAVVNPSNTAANISVVLYDTSGHTLGTSSIPLAAGNKISMPLRNLPGLAGVAGSRGSAVFTATSGNVAVLGLRFNGSAFTSIPAGN